MEDKLADMPDWSGHERDTRSVLLDVLTTATTDLARVSRADRVLFTACEFWAAARNGFLLDHLRGDPAAGLRTAETAFTVIGLTQASKVLHQARAAMAADGPPLALEQVAESIQRSLAGLDEPVDRMIAAYAAAQAANRQILSR